MRGRAQQQGAPRAQDAAHLREPPGGVGDVLDRLAGPHDIEARVLEWPVPLGRREAKVELRTQRARSAQRLLGHVEAGDSEARVGERRGELTLAAADVEHPRRPRLGGWQLGGAIEQEVPAQLEVGSIQALGYALPDPLMPAVVPAGFARAHRESKATRALRAAIERNLPTNSPQVRPKRLFCAHAQSREEGGR